MNGVCVCGVFWVFLLPGIIFCDVFEHIPGIFRSSSILGEHIIIEGGGGGSHEWCMCLWSILGISTSWNNLI